MDQAEESKWEPNRDFLRQLMEMGFSRLAAEQALYATDNHSIETATNYLFDSENEYESPSRIDLLNQHEPETESGNGSLQSKVEDSHDKSTNSKEEYKMVFVVNTSLKMSAGKMSAQVAHACLGLYRILVEDQLSNLALINWMGDGEKKVVVQGEDHTLLQKLQNDAQQKNLHSCLISDAGRTEIPRGSVTVLSIFGSETSVNSITGKLNLYK